MKTMTEHRLAKRFYVKRDSLMKQLLQIAASLAWNAF
jgi:hypothetical protein